MCLFLLPVSQSRISEPDISEVILDRRSHVFSAFDIIPDGLADKEGILETVKIPCYSGRIDPNVFLAQKSIRQLCRIGH